MVWPSCDGWPSGPFKAPTPRWEMIHPDKLKGPNSGSSVLLALSKCQNMNVKLKEHHFCSMLKQKLLVSCGAISYIRGFKSFGVPPEDEAEQLSSEGLHLKCSFILTTV